MEKLESAIGSKLFRIQFILELLSACNCKRPRNTQILQTAEFFFHLSVRFRKLCVCVFNHRHHCRLFRFLPIHTVITQVVGRNRERNLLAIAINKSTGFTDIGEIIRNQAVFAVLVGWHISFLRGDFPAELAGTCPDILQFRIVQRRIAFRSLFEELRMGILGDTEPLDQLSCHAGHGTVALSLWNAAVCFHELQPVLNGQTTFMPDHITLRAEQETRSIQCIAVEERQFLVDAGFDALVECSILAGHGRKKYMEARTGGN